MALDGLMRAVGIARWAKAQKRAKPTFDTKFAIKTFLRRRNPAS